MILWAAYNKTASFYGANRELSVAPPLGAATFIRQQRKKYKTDRQICTWIKKRKRKKHKNIIELLSAMNIFVKT